MLLDMADPAFRQIFIFFGCEICVLWRFFLEGLDHNVVLVSLLLVCVARQRHLFLERVKLMDGGVLV